MKKTFLAVSTTTGLFAAACIGPNNAFNAVQNWNAKLTNIRLVNEGIYLAGWIFPAYLLIWASDQLLWNSIEFWGGENPIPTPPPFTHPDD